MRMWTEVDCDTGVAYTLDIEPEDIPVRGNAMASGDDAVDRRAERWVNRQLRAGNQWAWCSVTVTASRGEHEGHDHLGACSYRDTQQFIEPGGYYEDLKDEAYRELLKAES
jgi:hypothetical protein